MHINLKNNWLVITFPYDQRIINTVRNISGRRFNPKLKHWEVPAENVLETIEALVPLGFDCHLDVVMLAKKAGDHREDVARAKVDPQTYTGRLPLYDFQKIGAGFLKTLPGALLADVPGLGKTIQTIAACEQANSVLILCPASLKYSWEAEIEKWAENKHSTLNSISVIDGDKKERRAKWNAVGKWYIANYELLLHDPELIARRWDVVVCDEATRISNPTAKTTKALKSLVAGKKIALTGTPISNSPTDIYSIIDWIAPGVLGNYFAFLKQYCIREERYNRIIAFKNLDKLSEVVSQYMLRRTKEEVLTDFPPKTIENISFELSEKEAELYENVRREIVEDLAKMGEKSENLSIIPVKMLRLKQVTDDPQLVGEFDMLSTKLTAAKELLAPVLASSEKAIIFTQFAEMAKILAAHFDTPHLIHGEVSAAERQEIVESFNHHEGGAVLVMTEAGAYGLNLQSASYVVHYDMPWSIAKLMQREDRAHRIGQSKPVTVYNLIARGTIDEYVAKVLKRKNKVSVDILQDAERLDDAGLEEEDIRAILRI